MSQRQSLYSQIFWPCHARVARPSARAISLCASVSLFSSVDNNRIHLIWLSGRLKVKVTQSCPALWTPQARILEWAAVPGIEPRSPTLQADSLPADPPGKPIRKIKWDQSHEGGMNAIIVILEFKLFTLHATIPFPSLTYFLILWQFSVSNMVESVIPLFQWKPELHEQQNQVYFCYLQLLLE